MGFMDSVLNAGIKAAKVAGKAAKACVEATEEEYSRKKAYYSGMSADRIASRLSTTMNPMDRIAMGAALKEQGYSQEEIRSIVESSKMRR